MNGKDKTPKTKPQKHENGNVRRPNDSPAPLPLQRESSQQRLVHVPGDWSIRNHSRGLGDRSRGLGDRSGGLGDRSHGQGGFAGGLGDHAHGLGGQVFVGMGYHSDLPDYRDYKWEDLATFIDSMQEAKSSHVQGLGNRAITKAPPDQYNVGDNTIHPLPPIENQGETNSCTAQAAAGMIEYLYRWATGDYNDFSRMFIYYNSRKLLGWSGDIGSYIRTTFKAMRLFGTPPEPEWPFDVSLLDTEPLPYHYAYASNFKTLNYARLDNPGEKPRNDGAKKLNAGEFVKNEPQDLYDRIKKVVYAGFPVEFGFPVYSCIQKLDGYTIPVPSQTDNLLGGHAVLAVGYNDHVSYDVPAKPSPKTSLGIAKEASTKEEGALIIRNSWGPDWGDHGYAFLPRWYIDEGYASDFWTAYDEEWLKLSDFGR